MQDKPEQPATDEARQGSTTLSRALAGSLARMKEIRDKIPPAIRNAPEAPANIAPYRRPPPSRPITREDLVRQLLKLDAIFPGSTTTPDQMTLRYQVFYDDLRHLTERELAVACERYRKNPENRFFPTLGQLLALTKW